ncbi:MAG: outer membrane beta-barrel protein [Nitrospinota bacterium]|jgi:opacity protein-like surface antigen|nr:outer membrane beta-barrel protein [Nitrospinota bacterium]MDH5790067.1 outer membrane beta-barrel protein [Nitrospinota bacterium]
MKRFLMTLVVAAVFMATSAQAVDGQRYASGNFSFGILTDVEEGNVEIDYDPGIGFFGAVGLDMGQIRVEGELGYRRFSIDEMRVSGSPVPANGHASAISLMANGYFDIEINAPVTPYVGVGLGFVDTNGARFSGTEIGYQFMTGVGYTVSPNAVLTAGYRFFGFTDNNGAYVHELNIGARFMF